MSEYDNTDSGAVFPPLEGQSLILTGKIDNAGEARGHVLIKDRDRDGNDIIVVCKRVGVLYQNNNKSKENAPDYSGPIDNDRRIAAWRAEKNGMRYLSVKITDKQQQQEPQEQATPSGPIPDHIPF